MDGIVTTRHLLTHSAVIVREFGGRCLLRCFWRTWTTHGTVTFLECALPRDALLPKELLPKEADWAPRTEAKSERFVS
jgi:hypothetical protein